MYTGEVVGSVVATVKDEGLANIPLLVVHLIENGEKTKMVVAADSTRQAGPGDFVYMIGSKRRRACSARSLLPRCCDSGLH
jgi:microcompartment protein CcmK/EutM